MLPPPPPSCHHYVKCLEHSYSRVAGKREKEKKALEDGGFVQSINTISIHVLPVLVAMLTLVLHTALGNNLTPAQVGLGVSKLLSAY